MNKEDLFWALIFVLFGLSCLAYSFLENPCQEPSISVAGRSVIQGTGITCLSVNYPGMALGAAMEGLGLYGMLSDMAGGYSYFSDDEKIDPPPVPKGAEFQIEIIKGD